MPDVQTHSAEENISSPKNRDELLMAIKKAGFDTFVVTERLHFNHMIWYRELVSRSESHPDNKARVIRELLSLKETDEVSQKSAFERYKKDYSDFYESGQPCIAKIVLKSGPLFLRFKANERRQFQDIVGLIPEDMLDVRDINNMFLYSMSEMG